MEGAVLDLEYARKELSRPSYDLYQKLSNLNTYDKSLICDSLEHFVASQKHYYEELTESELFPIKDSKLNEFSLIYAYNNASSESSNLISHNNLNFNGKELFFTKGYHYLLHDVLSSYSRLIDYNTSDTLNITKGFLYWINVYTDTLLSSDTYSSFLVKLGTRNFHQSDGAVLSREMVVGNETLIKQLSSSIRLLMLYDVEKKVHPHLSFFGPYHQRILAIGLPGCGKSLTLEVMVNEAKQLSSSCNKPLLVHDISSHLKSKYFGESAKNFKKIFDEVNKGDSLHILLVDDIDTVLFSRSEEEHSENISILGEFIKAIESVSSLNKGNYLLLGTTNRPETLDDALLRRFQSKILVEGPKTSDDYIRLLRSKLSGFESNKFVKILDWDYFGELFSKKKVSGSIIADIASDISELIVDTGFNDSIFKKSSDLVVEDLKRIYKPISDFNLVSVLQKRGLHE